jgi:hypothetical protein
VIDRGLVIATALYPRRAERVTGMAPPFVLRFSVAPCRSVASAQVWCRQGFRSRIDRTNAPSHRAGIAAFAEHASRFSLKTQGAPFAPSTTHVDGSIQPVHHAQILTYMKLTGCPAGLLINFYLAS